MHNMIRAIIRIMRLGYLFYASLALSISVSFASAEDKGNCPPSPRPTPPATKIAKVNPPPDEPGKTYVGSVFLLVVVSDKGYVCSSQVVQGVNKELNSRAVTVLHDAHFQPQMKDGRPAVPVLLTARVDFWRDKDGQLISSPTFPTSKDKDPPKP
jgi:hypothetical protein